MWNRPISRRTFIKAVGGDGARLRAVRLSARRRDTGSRPGAGGDPRPGGRAQVSDAAAHPTGHAAGGHDLPPGGKPADYYEISVRQFSQQILPAGLPPTTVWGYGAVTAQSKRGLLVHNAPSLTIEAQARPAGAGEVDQRAGRRRRQLSCRTCCRSTRRCTGRTRPAARRAGTRGRRSPRRPGRTPARCRWSPTCTAPSASATRATATPRPGTCRRRTTSRRLRHGGHLVRLLRRQGARQLRRDLGAGLRDLPVPEPGPRVDQLVPRPHAGHDPAQRVRRTGRLLPRPRRPGRRRGGAGQPGRQRGRAPGPGAEGGRHVPVQQDLLRDPDRDPGPVVQRRRLAVLPRLAGRSSTASSRTTSRRGLLPDLEPGVLRQHDHGQRQHLAVPDRRAAALPVPAS